jgi:hypothetical protein
LIGIGWLDEPQVVDAMFDGHFLLQRKATLYLPKAHL